jgi:hypothetical protein
MTGKKKGTGEEEEGGDPSRNGAHDVEGLEHVNVYDVSHLAPVEPVIDRQEAASALVGGGWGGDILSRLRPRSQAEELVDAEPEPSVEEELETPPETEDDIPLLGARLTEAQLRQIAAFQAAGDIPSAQGIILDALEHEVGDAAVMFHATAPAPAPAPALPTPPMTHLWRFLSADYDQGAIVPQIWVSPLGFAVLPHDGRVWRLVSAYQDAPSVLMNAQTVYEFAMVLARLYGGPDAKLEGMYMRGTE